LSSEAEEAAPLPKRRWRKKPPNLKREHKEGNARREREIDDVRGQNDRPLLHVSVSSTTGLPHHQPLASDLWV
jgi:hypothetical protein